VGSSLWKNGSLGVRFLLVLSSVLAVSAPAHGATQLGKVPIDGVYRVTTHATSPASTKGRVQTAVDHIDWYDTSTGRLTGHGVTGGQSYTFTGTLTGSRIKIRVSSLGVTAVDTGKISPDRQITGTVVESDIGTTITGAWTMTPVGAGPPAVVTYSPPPVTVQASGMTQMTALNGTRATYGVVLSNPAPQLDAVGVTATLTFLDQSGGPIATETQHITVIPHSSTFAFGGELDSPLSATLGSIRTNIVVKWGATAGLQPLTVSDVTAGPYGNEGACRVSGAATNSYRVPLSSDEATACAVVSNSAGAVLGGDCEDLGAALGAESLAPGATAGLAIPFLDDFPGLASQIASGTISIDPGSVVLPKVLGSSLP
jgi:hypothetical protein